MARLWYIGDEVDAPLATGWPERSVRIPAAGGTAAALPRARGWRR